MPDQEDYIMDPQSVRIVRVEERLNGLEQKISDFRDHMDDKIDLLVNLVQTNLDRDAATAQARYKFWMSVLQPKVVLSLVALLAMIIAAVLGINFTWGDIVVGGE